MNVDLIIGPTCVKPELGMVYISKGSHPATGVFSVIINGDKEHVGQLRTIPLLFAKNRGCSTNPIPLSIIPIAHLSAKQLSNLT